MKRLVGERRRTLAGFGLDGGHNGCASWLAGVAAGRSLTL